MDVKGKLTAVKDRAVDYCRENKAKIAIVGGSIVAGVTMVLCYGSGYRDGERVGEVKGFNVCNTFLGGLVNEYDPETHQKVQNIIDEHSVEYMEKLEKE